MKNKSGTMSLWISIAVASIATLVAVAEWLLGQSLCGWEFRCPLDDAYIHMALARQLATSGTWGLEPGVLVFASSSSLWPILLAVVFKLFGAREWLPLVLSYVFVFGSVILAFLLCDKAGLRRYVALYDKWYDLQALSSGMHVVARLVMEYPRVICSDVEVALCVTDERDAKRFEQHLMEFARKLPAGVHLDFQVDRDAQNNM